MQTQRSVKIGGKFYLETQVKCQIATHFLRDARDWLNIYKILETQQKDYISMSFEAKKYSNLRFSLECSLKSLIMSLSKKNESASKAYRIIRGHKHNLINLYKECLSRGGKKCRVISPRFSSKVEKIENVGVGIRYDMDFKTAYKRQSLKELFIDGPISAVVLDNAFRKEFFHEAFEIYKRASKVRSRRFAKHLGCTGDKIGKIEDYIRNIIK